MCETKAIQRNYWHYNLATRTIHKIYLCLWLCFLITEALLGTYNAVREGLSRIIKIMNNNKKKVSRRYSFFKNIGKNSSMWSQWMWSEPQSNMTYRKIAINTKMPGDNQPKRKTGEMRNQRNQIKRIRWIATAT